ncbi:DUF6888 family protein [Coleofasciculus sp. LEGE 07092]
MYQPIFLVRLDERTGNLFILAGEDIRVNASKIIEILR